MIKFLFKKQLTIGGAAALLGFFTILSQILGILKNKLLAIHFGASMDLDIFYTAFKIPDIIFLIIGGMAMGSILIPIFTDKENISSQEKENFMAGFFNSFSLILIVVSGIIFLILPYLLKEIFPAYDGKDFDLLLFMSRLFLLSPIFMGLANFFVAINQRNRIFLPIALTGLLYNISIILGILILSPFFGIKGVAYGIIFGAFLYLIIQLPSIFKNKLFFYKLRFLKREELMMLAKITFPRSVALAISSLVIIYIYSEISDLQTPGLVTIFSFAYAVFWLPIGLINASYAQAMFPTIAKFYSQGKIEEFNNTIKDIFSRIFFLVIPVSVFIFIFSELIVAILFGSQKFGILEIKSTALSLSLFAILTPFLVSQLTISKIFYAMGRTRDVMYANLSAGVMIFILMNTIKDSGIKIIDSLKYMDNFNDLFLMIVVFVVPYILVSTYMVFFIKRASPGLKIVQIKKVSKQIFVALISVSITYIIFFLFSVDIYENIKLDWIYFILGGIAFGAFEVLFSEVFQESNYLDFKKKILMRLKRGK